MLLQGLLGGIICYQKKNSVFTNNQIDIDALPRFEGLKLEPIASRYFYIIVINTIFLYAGLAVVLSIVNAFADTDSFIKEMFWYILGFLVLACLFQTLIYRLGFKKRKYGLREKDIIYAHGYFVNQITTLPFNRIQHIEVARSFLARRFGLSTLKIYSAGESGGDMKISGLPKSVADAQYAFLTQILNERL